MEDSLDIVELVMAIEESLDRDLTAAEGESLRSEIEARRRRGDFEDGDLDDAIAVFVRNLGPRRPRGHSGAAARPEDAV